MSKLIYNKELRVNRFEWHLVYMKVAYCSIIDIHQHMHFFIQHCISLEC